MEKRPSSPNELRQKSASSGSSDEADFLCRALDQSLSHLSQSFPELQGQPPLIVGVSGGRDSVVLLHALKERWAHGPLIVAHVNHLLRGEVADEDAAWVQQLAGSWELGFESKRVPVTELAAAQHCSLETAGRLARETFFAELCEKHQTPFVFLAHHADDQAETVLSNLCRGASGKGLQGIKPWQNMRAGWIKIRPLLTSRRAWIDAYVARHQLSFREDATNAVADVRRNRLRLEALPLLHDIFQRDVANSLIKVTQHLALDEAYFETLLQAWWQRRDFYDPAQPHELRLVPEFLELHPAVRNRLLHQWLTLLEVSDLSQALIQQVDAMLQPEGPAKINLPKGFHLRRKQKRLWLQSPQS